MDRSNFYYDQEVREQELDAIYDDVEDMEQDKIIDQDLWGVWSGLVVQEASVPDLTVDVTAGVAHDELGRRIVVPSTQNVDLTSYVPAGVGDEVQIHIYAVDDDTLSDTRTDGHGASIDYRATESFEIAIVAGVEGTPPASPPSIVANQVLLAEVELNQGMASILDADITAEWSTTPETRHVGGIAARLGRFNDQSIAFDDTVDVLLTGITRISLRSGTPGTDQGINMNFRDLEQVGKIEMRAGAGGGLGIEMNDTPITEVENITLETGTATGLTMSGNDIVCDAGDVLEATQVQAEQPDPASGEGFLYADPATGTLRDVVKYAAFKASDAFAGDAGDDPWQAVGTYWTLDEPSHKGGNLAWGGLEWRFNFGAGSEAGTKGLHYPILIPNGAKLIDANMSYEVDGAGMSAAHVLRMWLIRRGRTGTIDIIGADPPSGETNAATGNYNWTENYTAAATNIVNNSAYSYEVVITHYTATTVTSENVVGIKDLVIEYQIREPSGIY